MNNLMDLTLEQYLLRKFEGSTSSAVPNKTTQGSSTADEFLNEVYGEEVKIWTPSIICLVQLRAGLTEYYSNTGWMDIINYIRVSNNDMVGHMRLEENGKRFWTKGNYEPNSNIFHFILSRFQLKL